MSDQNRGRIPPSNIDAALNLLQLCVGIQDDPYHPRGDGPMAFLQDINTEQRFMCVGGRYFGMNPPLLDEDDVSAFRVTQDGKLMVDATVSISPEGGFDWKFYWEGYVGLGAHDVLFYGVGLDDMTADGSGYTGTASAEYRVRIHTVAATDTIEFSDDGGVTWDDNGGVGYAITGAAQPLSDGLTVTFAAVAGHTATEYWTFMAAPDALVINFGNIAQEVTLFNDGQNDLFYEYNASAIPGSFGQAGVTYRMLAGEAFADDFQSPNIHLAVNSGESTLVRIWARGNL